MYFLRAGRDRSIFPYYLFSFRMLISGDIFNNPKMLADAHSELRPSPLQVIQVTVMIYLFFIHDFEF